MSRRLGLALACIVLGAATAVTAAPTLASSTATSARLQGANRYQTAAAIAAAKFPNGVGGLVLASGLSYPDALAGAYLAGQGPAGILLTDPATVLPDLTTALTNLKVRNIVILGGTSAVSADVENQLGQTPSTASGAANLQVKRLQGANRYDTMAAIDTQLGPTVVGSVGGKPTAIIASGANFPDALAAAPAAYGKHLPIVLTEPDHLSAQAQQTLTALGIQQVLIMGGGSALSSAVVSAIQAMGIAVLKQFAGADRTDTAQQFAAYEVANLGFSNAEITIARGDDFADALAGAQYAGDPKPTLLAQQSSGLGPYTTKYLTDNGAGNNKITGFGGSSALTDTTLGDAVNDSQGHPTCGGGPCSGGGTGAITITPNAVPNDSADHPVVITGPFADAAKAWISLPVNPPAATPPGCHDGSTIPVQTTKQTATEIDGILNVSNFCTAGTYDLHILLIHPADNSQQTLTCQACLTVGAAATLKTIAPNQAGNDGTDGYTHPVVITGNNLAALTAVWLQFTGTVDPGLCNGGVVDVTNLTANGPNELDGVLSIQQDCPPGVYDLMGRGGSIDAVCAKCFTVEQYIHQWVIDSITPTSGRKGTTFPITITGHGLQKGDLFFAIQNPNGPGVIYAFFSGSYYQTPTQITATISPSAGTYGSGGCGTGADCAPPGNYLVIMREKNENGNYIPLGTGTSSTFFNLLPPGG
jgi:putative cell wall-binding protein